MNRLGIAIGTGVFPTEGTLGGNGNVTFLGSESQRVSFFSRVAARIAQLALDLSSGSLDSDSLLCYPTKRHETRAPLDVPTPEGIVLG